MSEEIKKDTPELEWEILNPDQVYDEDHLTITLKRPFISGGVESQKIVLRYPTQGDMSDIDKKAKNKKYKDDNDRIEDLILKLAVEPLMDPDAVGNIAASDFNFIQKKLDESGYFGIGKKASEEDDADDDNDFHIPNPEEVLDDTILTVPIKRSVSIGGTVYESIGLRYPCRRDMKLFERMDRQKKFPVESDRISQMIETLSETPKLDRVALHALAVSDFNFIQKRLDESGFLGVIRTSM